jgi:divalent metal cation (Fe/Co/Zn/Cd) transporter
MDRAIPADERERIVAILERVKERGGDYHRLRTRVSGKKSFVDVHILVPGAMSVHDAHDLAHGIEHDIEAAVPHVEVLTHLESLEDPRSWDDPEKPMAGS